MLVISGAVLVLLVWALTPVDPDRELFANLVVGSVGLYLFLVALAVL